MKKQQANMEMGGPSGGGQEPILPAVLEFPETHQDAFLHQVIVDLNVNAPYFKLAPVYTLYLCARYFSVLSTSKTQYFQHRANIV